MKNTIYLFAIICLSGAIVAGFQNQQSLKQNLVDFESVKQRKILVTQQLLAKEERFQDLAEAASVRRDDRNLVSARIDENKLELRQVQRKGDSRQEELTGLQIKQKELDLAVKALFGEDGIQTVEQLEASRRSYRSTLSSLEMKIGELEEEVEYLKVKNGRQLEIVGQEEIHQLKRLEKMALSQLEAKVVGVNQDWGFVIVNAGKAHGIETGARFLVKRGDRQITRLTISHLREAVCLCRVVSGSGEFKTVELGDSVIVKM